MLKGKILLIENDSSYGEFVNSLLVRIGYDKENILRCSYSEQLRQFKDYNLDIIVVDLTLQLSNYRQDFKTLLSNYPYVPLIVLTEVPEIDQMICIMGQGAQEYLVKGDFTEKDLARAIRYATERKKQDNSYKRLFAESPTPMYIYDENTFQFFAVNAAALKQYGYSEEEFLAMNATQIRPQEEVEAFSEASSKGPDQYYDFGRWRHVRKNGETFYVHIYASATEFQGVKSRLILAVDINKKVLAEKAVERKSRQVENIIESITDGFFAINDRWEFVYVNKECERIFQRDRRELVGKCAWELFPQGRNLKFYGEYSRAMLEQTSVHFEEFDPVYKVWVSASAYPTEEGLSVYFRDITKEKSLQEKIFNDEQNLRAIINNTMDVIWSVDRNFSIISANEAFWARIHLLTGKTARTITNEDIELTLLGTWQQYFQKAFNGESHKILWKEDKNNNCTYEEVSFNPIRNQKNEVIGISCFSRDVTEHQQHLQKIEHQNEQLKKIAWSQSHEVRKPVANILGLVQLLQCETANEESKTLLTYIKKSAEDLDEIIRNITSYTINDANHHN